MLWTAFVWGFGVSCGAGIGLLLFFCAFWPLQAWAQKGQKLASAVEVNRLSLAELSRRNDIGEDQANLLERIAKAVEVMERK